MKTLKLTGLLLCIFIINSCTTNTDEDIPTDLEIILGEYPHSYYHRLILSFQDVSGNDLLNELHNAMDCVYYAEVKRGLYTFKVDFEDGIPNPYEGGSPSIYICKGAPDNIFPELNDDYCYLRFVLCGSRTYPYGVPEGAKQIPFSEKITFTLRCPYLFENNAAHEIVTWWKPSEERFGTTTCYRIEFGSKEFTEIYHSTKTWYSMATLFLDR